METDQSKAIRFIVQALADDYESIETLENYYTEPQSDIVSFSRVEVTQALTKLVGDGYVQPYMYSESDQKLVHSEFSPSSAERFWFGLTNKGREFLSRLTEGKSENANKTGL